MSWNQGPRDEHKDEKPPYSRVFVVCSKDVKDTDLRNAFEGFGEVEDIHIPRDHNSGIPKGVAYIKYAKTSAAAAAIQEMHMKTLEKNSYKPLKVMVACNKDGNRNDSENENKYKRLFIKVHRDASETEIRKHFSDYGQVEAVRFQRDKITEECKGFAYVTFKTFLDAAKAFEECDRKYKAVFAKPKEELKRSRNSIEPYMDNFSNNSNPYRDDRYSNNLFNPNDIPNHNIATLIKTKSDNYNTINVTCCPQVAQKYIETLFNIIPGVVQFRFSLDRSAGISKATITYESEKAAAYALEKLDNYEFPSGEIIFVKPDNNPLCKAANSLNNIVNSLKNAVDNPDLTQLADAIAHASTLIKAATSAKVEIKHVDSINICSVPLPPQQPLVDPNTRIAKRCFLVFRPQPPPIEVLKDVFCRFGDLIDVVVYRNKTFGFAKYASEDSANLAIKTLHGATVCGIKIKVIEADEKKTRDDRMQVDDPTEGSEHDNEVKRMRLDNVRD